MKAVPRGDEPRLSSFPLPSHNRLTSSCCESLDYFTRHWVCGELTDLALQHRREIGERGKQLPTVSSLRLCSIRGKTTTSPGLPSFLPSLSRRRSSLTLRGSKRQAQPFSLTSQRTSSSRLGRNISLRKEALMHSGQLSGFPRHAESFLSEHSLSQRILSNPFSSISKSSFSSPFRRIALPGSLRHFGKSQSDRAHTFRAVGSSSIVQVPAPLIIPSIQTVFRRVSLVLSPFCRCLVSFHLSCLVLLSPGSVLHPVFSLVASSCHFAYSVGAAWLDASTADASPRLSRSPVQPFCLSVFFSLLRLRYFREGGDSCGEREEKVVRSYECFLSS